MEIKTVNRKLARLRMVYKGPYTKIQAFIKLHNFQTKLGNYTYLVDTQALSNPFTFVSF